MPAKKSKLRRMLVNRWTLAARPFHLKLELVFMVTPMIACPGEKSFATAPAFAPKWNFEEYPQAARCADEHGT